MDTVDLGLRDPAVEEFDTRTLLREAARRRGNASTRIS